MKRMVLVAAAGLALAGCVEVTRFPAQGGDVYLADCDQKGRLESCRAALESVCPKGYDPIAAVRRDDHGKLVATKSGYFRCR